MLVVRFLILALLVCSVGSSFAQHAILTGMVLDAKTSRALSGANVVIESDSITTGTAVRSNGTFQFKQLAPGQYDVTISFIGYRTETLTDVRLRPGQTRWLDIRLVSAGIQLNPVTVTASRNPEKLLEAPAAVTVIEQESIEDRTALTATEHLKAMPAVDVITAGLNQSRVVVRGFNDLFSGALLSMVDNRITRVPAVRLNAFQMIPTSNEDVERIEVVSGPASALYGPNSANGVMHVLTKSPFDSKGTTVSVGGGEQDVFIASARHAGSIGDYIGYKLSLQHYQGKDFSHIDSVEVRFRQAAITGGADADTLRIGRRTLDIRSTALDGRLDVRFTPDFKIILNSGFSNGDNIEITNQGAAQASNATFNYVQGRVRYKNLFFQTFLNGIRTGDTYFLRTGKPVINNSSLWATQARHNFTLGRKQTFTYGMDVLLTRPKTERTVNGKNEDNDHVNEIGGYLQSETALSKKFKLLAAARLDHHSRLEGLNVSPRAALVYQPTPKDNFRLTFNRAFTTPTTDMLFSDIPAGSQPTAAIDPGLVPFFGDTLSNVRALGTWPSGFSFRYSPDNRPQMVSSFTGIYGNQYFSPDVNPVWPAIRDLLISGARDDIERGFLETFLPDSLSGHVPGVFKILDTESPDGKFDQVDASFVRDIRSVSESSNTTFEFGYKGLLGKNLLASVDLYHTRIKDFIGPLSVITPNVFIDTLALETVLTDDFTREGLPAVLAELIADQLTDSLATLPIGMVSPEQVQNGTDVILSYRNLGDVAVTGLDLSLTYHAGKRWSVTGNYSFVNRDFFKSKNGYSDIALNAPKHKVGGILSYRNSHIGFNGNLRLRFVDSFPIRSGTFRGKVDRYAVVDLNASYRMPFSHETKLSLTVQNLTNNRHREFVGVPRVGRLAWMRLTQTL